MGTKYPFNKYRNNKIRACFYCHIPWPVGTEHCPSCKKKDFVTFDSNGEFKRWHELLLLRRAGEIFALGRQNLFVIKVNGIRICNYKADFHYAKKVPEGKDIWIVEDYKGMILPEFRLKWKLMQACYPDYEYVLSGPGGKKKEKRTRSKR